MSLGRFFPWLWAVVVASVVAHNAYLWWGQRFIADTDILALLPLEQRDPALQRAFTHMVDATQQRLIVLIGAADGAEARRAADAYSEVLAPHGNLIQSAGRITDQTGSDWAASFEGRRLSLMTPQDEASLLQSTSKVLDRRRLGEII